MIFKVERSADGDVVVFTLMGRIQGEQVEQLRSLFESETEGHRIVLDMEQVDLVDRDAVRFLARCVAEGITLERCPGYIREWILREGDGE